MSWHIRHAWVSVKAQQMVLTRHPLGLSYDTSITEVLQRCARPDCPALRTITLDGSWTTDDVARAVDPVILRERP